MKALLIVDVQNDFCPGGALSVPDGDAIVPIINKLMNKFEIIIASKDWHPPTAIEHFNKWPIHCIQYTQGAELHPNLKKDKINDIFLKGTSNEDDGYSAFEATNINLENYLKKNKVTDLYITGLATEYCVKNTALDAISKNYTVFIITDAIRAINAKEGDEKNALNVLKWSGASFVLSTDIKK